MEMKRIARELLAVARTLVASEDDELLATARKHGVSDLDKKVVKNTDASDFAGAEYGDPHTYSMRELYKEYKDGSSAKYSYPDFDAWLEDVTGKNGACEWISHIERDLYSIDGVDGYSFAEAEAIARQRKDKGVEVLDSNFERWVPCAWCEDLYPESELSEEDDLGPICEHCEMAILSRGEELHFRRTLR